ncbi:NAD(P)H-binding protein [Streptomyces sp. NBC_00249]|uniref:NAD(P)H-binding protein n=1 Tax=Streptomyces sp. NBC_00249 TaxID=2975690 RepID=UPI00225A0086|nr:NAD(P)H-binding protein [Streptomyces sp. NBC_00249]MCX5199596.1 NAD(P)H-binding protein [Streptomyces sp. NBC_00249]
MNENPVLVIGGTGKTGRRVVRQLTERGIPVRSASRKGETRFDWLDETTWGPALEGVTGVYIVQNDTAPRTRELAEHAARAGVQRLVLLSARGVETPGYYGEDSSTSDAFLAGEAAVRESGLAWTVLRPGWFAQNFDEGFFNEGVLAGELRLPAGDGAATWIDVEDIAAVAVAALTEDGHDGQTYELSGPRPVPLAEVLSLIEAETGRKATYTALSTPEFVAELGAQGVPAPDAALWAAALHPVARGFEAKVSDGVPRALGREARDFADFVKSAAAAGAWRA